MIPLKFESYDCFVTSTDQLGGEKFWEKTRGLFHDCRLSAVVIAQQYCVRLVIKRLWVHILLGAGLFFSSIFLSLTFRHYQNHRVS